MGKPLEEQPWVIATAAAVAAAVVKVNGVTLRWDVRGWKGVAELERQGERCIFCFWHNRLLYIGYHICRIPLTMLISRSKDGAYIAALSRMYGIEAVRGSSTRGGARALVEMVALARSSTRHVGITPDGPKGPLYEVQPGLVVLAQKTGLPVVPVSLSATRVHRFASWDRFLVPLPFARVHVRYGTPMVVAPGRDVFEQERLRLQRELRRLTIEADRAAGQPFDPELEDTP